MGSFAKKHLAGFAASCRRLLHPKGKKRARFWRVVGASCAEKSPLILIERHSREEPYRPLCSRIGHIRRRSEENEFSSRSRVEMLRRRSASVKAFSAAS